MRDEERDSMKKSYEEQLRKVERDRNDLKNKLRDKDQIIAQLNIDIEYYRQEVKQREEQLASESSRLKSDFESRLNEYEDSLNQKTEETKKG